MPKTKTDDTPTAFYRKCAEGAGQKLEAGWFDVKIAPASQSKDLAEQGFTSLPKSKASK